MCRVHAWISIPFSAVVAMLRLCCGRAQHPAAFLLGGLPIPLVPRSGIDRPDRQAVLRTARGTSYRRSRTTGCHRCVAEHGLRSMPMPSVARVFCGRPLRKHIRVDLPHPPISGSRCEQTCRRTWCRSARSRRWARREEVRRKRTWQCSPYSAWANAPACPWVSHRDALIHQRPSIDESVAVGGVDSVAPEAPSGDNDPDRRLSALHDTDLHRRGLAAWHIVVDVEVICSSIAGWSSG